MGTNPAQDPRFVAGLDLLKRTGAKEVQIRYSDDPEPVIWMVVVEYKDGKEAAAALDPLTAMLRILDTIIDGGVCVHCKKMSAVTDRWEIDTPLNDHVCWYIYDPEVKKFRRSCEGDEKVGRNDPCPCGSGAKFKNCHGNPN